MNASANTRMRVARAGAAVAVASALAAGAWYGYDLLVSRPVKHVVFAGSTERIPPAALEALAEGVQAAPGPVSLAALRDAARRLPWVRDAAVRRRFPDTVEIRFDTHEPLARWNDFALVSRRGEVFIADYATALPRFRGPDGGAQQMATQYPSIEKALAPLGGSVAELRLSARGAWQVTLDSGLDLVLGRGDVEARIARFVAAFPDLKARGIAVAHADLRYPNGFALRRADDRAAAPKVKRT